MTPQEMSDEDWAAYRSYADQVIVALTPVESPDQEDTGEEWVIVSHGAAWEQNWLVREVESIGLGTTSVNGEFVRGDYVLRVRETRFSWGADAASYQILLLLAQWAATSAAWDVLKSVASKMATRLSADESELPLEPLTDNEVENRGRWFIQARYGEDSGQLETSSVEITGGHSATVVLVSRTGWSYECDLAIESQLVTIGRVKKFRSNGLG